MMRRRSGRGVLLAGLAALVASSPSVVALESSSKLIDAVKAGDRSAALSLIDGHSDVNAAEADGTSALHWAAAANDRALVAALLEAGADATAVNRYGITALQLAVENGDEQIARALLAAGADVNATLPEGETILMTAARTGAPAVLRVLVEHGASLEARESWHGESALIWAVAEDHADAVAALAELGADVNGRSALQEFPRRRASQSLLPLGHWTPLMYAARQNALASGKVLISLATDVDATDPDGATALALAIINANYEFAALLLDAGADPNIVDTTGMGPLYALADMRRLAVGHGRPNPKQDGPFDSALLLQRLLERGANPNAELTAPIIQRQHTFGDGTLGKGATPLLRAAKSGDIDAVRLLLAAGADPWHTMANGATALLYAAGLGWRDGSPIAPSFDQGSPEEAVETIRLLLELGLDIHAKTDNGETVLHAAVGRNEAAIVKCLLEAGADVSVVDGRGQTPLELAEARRASAEVIELLRGAQPAGAEVAARSITGRMNVTDLRDRFRESESESTRPGAAMVTI
jgi:uncharacterized protein